MRRRVVVEVVGDTVLVRFKEKRLDGADVESAGEPFSRQRQVQLDMSGVEHMTSDALAKLVALHKQAKAVGAHVSLSNVGPALYNLLDRTRLNKLLDVGQAEGQDQSPG